jgi:ABC-type multidrug transport system ATPase subunit
MVARPGALSPNNDQPPPPAVAASHLRKVFTDVSSLRSHVALADVSLTVRGGEVFGLLGPNGAGKSTLVSVVIGAAAPTEGECRVLGEDVASCRALFDGSVSFCGQSDALWPHMTVREHIMLFLALKNIRSEGVETVLSEFGIAPHGDKTVATCSGGTRRKLSVALAMMGGDADVGVGSVGAKLVVLDEPTSGVDPETRRFIWDRVRGRAGGRSVILSTHSMEEAEELCSTIGVKGGAWLLSQRRS